MTTGLFYFGFLAGFALVYRLLPGKASKLWLLIVAGVVFTGYFDRRALVIFLIMSAFTYWAGSRVIKRRVFIVAIMGLLSILITFKYLGLLAPTIIKITQIMGGNPHFRLEDFFLPLGLSFLTFRLVSYLTDLRWGLIDRGTFPEFLAYCLFFPITVAGPIERFSTFHPQLKGVTRRFDNSHYSVGFQRIVFGLFKKLVIADWVGFFIKPVWEDPAAFPEAIRVLAMFGFAVQIYMDFAGYSDIAVGSARMFGLTVMENFNDPYSAPNIGQFWRRWHISLSDWIRDYLFFPLSRISDARMWLMLGVPVIAMALCGFWHGRESHYIVWGVWHGLGLAVFQYWTSLKRRYKQRIAFAKTRWFALLSRAVTFLFVCVGWLIFMNEGGIARGLLTFSALGWVVLGVLGGELYLWLRNTLPPLRLEKTYWAVAVLTFILVFGVCMTNTGFIYEAF